MKWTNIVCSFLCIIALVLSCVSAAQVKVIKGEQGEQGIQGIQGIQGEKGDKGDKGDQGIQGVAGLDGKDGQDGIDGVDGKDGRDGVDGKDGEKGDKGDKGDRGEQGIQGIQGIPGRDGLSGVNGTNGKDGLDGADGLTPYIKNGTWWIGDKDTKVSATPTSNSFFVVKVGRIWVNSSHFGNSDFPNGYYGVYGELVNMTLNKDISFWIGTELWTEELIGKTILIQSKKAYLSENIQGVQNLHIYVDDIMILGG